MILFSTIWYSDRLLNPINYNNFYYTVLRSFVQVVGKILKIVENV